MVSESDQRPADDQLVGYVERFQERAAIAMHDGELSASAAETLAWDEVYQQWELDGCPVTWEAVCAAIGRTAVDA